MPTTTSSPARVNGDPFANVRASFSGAAKQVYLDVASRSLIPDSALKIAEEHLQDRVQGCVDKKKYFDIVEEARSRFAKLIGAHPSEIALTKNVSEGLNIIATAIEWRLGDEVVLCSDIEHPNNVYSWRNQERRGAMIVDLPSENGEFPLGAVVARLRDKKPPRVVTVSATSFRPGFRTDLQVLGAECERSGTLLVVDGAQSVGVNHLDVSTSKISALAVSTQKGLCALYGMGFLYVHRDVAESLKPPQLARFGVDISATHEADYDKGPIQFRKAALRFDLGNYNFLAANLVNHSMALIETCGTIEIDKHVTRLADILSSDLIAGGLPVLSPTQGPRSHIVCLSLKDDKDSAASLQKSLAGDGVLAAVRANMLRFSIHFYNNEQDIRRASEAVKKWYRSSRP